MGNAGSGNFTGRGKYVYKGGERGLQGKGKGRERDRREKEKGKRKKIPHLLGSEGFYKFIVMISA